MEIVKGFIEGIINIYSNNPKLLLETIILILKQLLNKRQARTVVRACLLVYDIVIPFG